MFASPAGGGAGERPNLPNLRATEGGQVLIDPATGQSSTPWAAGTSPDWERTAR